MLNKHKYLTDDELKLVRATLSKYRASDARNVLIMDLLLATGARIGELLAIRPKDLNPVESSIFFHGLKGSYDREIPLKGELFRRLQFYSEHCPESDRIFKLGYNRVRDIWAYYSPVKKKLHSLRHTFAINLYKKSKDIRLVQRALGHKHLNTTLIYQEYQYSLDELKNAIL